MALQGSGKERYVFFSFPHIGIDAAGSLGSISRPGRPGASSACGALKAALGDIQGEGLAANCKCPGGMLFSACRPSRMQHLSLFLSGLVFYNTARGRARGEHPGPGPRCQLQVPRQCICHLILVARCPREGHTPFSDACTTLQRLMVRTLAARGCTATG